MEPQVFEYKSFGETVKLEAYQTRYMNNDTPAVVLVVAEDNPEASFYAGEDWATLTVNLPASGSLPDGYAFIDTNNCPEALVTAANSAGIIDISLEIPCAASGFCIYPAARINPNIKTFPEE